MEITKQSSRKRQKLISGENTDEADPVDRLSALPDDIICHILSLLPTKHSLRTSALAKRWRFMWAHVPNLDFDCKRHTLSISNIINRFLSLQRLNIFRLSINKSNNFELNCVCVLPPPRLFTCKALVDLSLCCCGTIPIDGTTTVCLPALKKLSLDRAKYESDESLPRLLSGCPVLEELTIHREGNKDNMICCYISSPTLKRVFLTSRCSEYVSAGALTSLTEAFLDFCAPMTLAKARSVLEFVSRLCNVEYLSLQTEEMTRVPDSEFNVFTTKFRNLVKLELEADWRLITKLLENADNLQVLVINTSESDLKGWMDPKQVPACLVSRLGSVRIDYFGCTEDELNLVRYILRNAKVLERMFFHTYRKGHVYKRIDSKRKYEASERISLFERGSKSCELVFD